MTSIPWTKVTLITTAASFLAYYANAYLKEYKEFVNGELDEDGPVQSRGQALGVGAGRRKPTKKSGNSSLERISKELHELYQNAQQAMEEENLPMAVSLFERILEISEDNPSASQAKGTALSHLFKISTQLNNSELVIKYSRKIIDYIGKPNTPEQTRDVLNFHEILVDKLLSLEKTHEAVNTIKNIFKRYKLTDNQYAEQLSILNTIYQTHPETVGDQENLETIKKSIEYSKKTGEIKLMVNALFDYIYYCAQTGDMEKLKESQDEIEAILPQLSTGYFKTTGDILLKFKRYPEFITQRNRFITFLRENPSELSLEKTSFENFINGLSYEVACAHMELSESDKAIEILDQLMASEYLSYTPITKTKFFTVQKAKSKNATIRINLLVNDSDELTEEMKNGIVTGSVKVEGREEPLTLEKPMVIKNKTLKFKFQAPEGEEIEALNSKTSNYLVKFEFTNQDKSQTFSSFYQIIAAQEPIHPLQKE